MTKKHGYMGGPHAVSERAADEEHREEEAYWLARDAQYAEEEEEPQ